MNHRNQILPTAPLFYPNKQVYQTGIRKIFYLPAYHWVLIAATFVALCHLWYLPKPLFIMGVISGIFAMPKFVKKGRKHYDALKIGFFLAGTAYLWLHFKQSFGVDVGISFLFTCAMAKLWELKQRRDGYVMLNLLLFMLASAFLWTQSLFMTLMCFVALLAVLFAFIALSDDIDAHDNARDASNSNAYNKNTRLRTLGLIGAPAIPLLIILFLFFPRINPLWSISLAAPQATTGISDSMSPGDFANLSKSTELAFRVTFDASIPPPEQLYWRGLVFNDFDGITWRRGSEPSIWASRQLPNEIAASLDAPTSSYRIFLEPTHEKWLFALDYPSPKVKKGIGLSEHYTLHAFNDVDTTLRYDVNYHPNAKINTNIDIKTHKINTALPTDGNAQSRQLARDLFAKANGHTPTFINLVQAYIRQNNFTYTLSPTPLHNERVDEFLFGTKAGFCEHYASSFVFLMRAANIPSRVVTGYLGGEIGADGKSFEVRQKDAHAWAEVWIENEGWRRVDPTGFVAPERVLDGIDALTDADAFGGGFGGAIGYQQYKFMKRLRRYSDQIGYYWQNDIIDYDADAQKSSLSNWFNIHSIAQQLYALGAGILLFGGAFFIFWRRQGQKFHPLDAPIMRLSNRLGKKDSALSKQSSETILHYLTRLHDLAKRHFSTQNASTDDIKNLSELYTALYTHYRQNRFGTQKHGNHKKFIKQVRQFLKLLQRL